MFDVPQEQYATVIREMTRHENEVTNHRIMWLLVGQGFIANAHASSMGADKPPGYLLPLVGILITLSAFLMLYRSYQARSYLAFLGQQAKQGLLQVEHLPITGWPKKKIKGWWKTVCVCRWFRQYGDLLEPWLFLPSIFLYMWVLILMKQFTRLPSPVDLMLGAFLTAVILIAVCIGLVWSQVRDEKRDM